MDYAKELFNLRSRKAALLDEADKLIAAHDFTAAAKKQDEAEEINTQIAVTEKQAAMSAEGAVGSQPKSEEVTPFRNLGEQLQAVYNCATKHTTDSRLARINDAVQGANEGTGADGGFAIQTNFAGQIMESAVQESELLKLIDRYTVGSGANSAKWLQVDETDVSSSVFGGVQMYWASEGATVAASKPQFREMKLDLEKMMGLAYATDELLEDAPFMSGFFERGFRLGADRLLTASVLAGDGVGKPLGILNSGALTTVAKTSGQTADTITGANVMAMWQRLLPRSKRNAVWVLHPDCEEFLPRLSIAATGGSAEKFLWDPEGGLSGLNYQRILGRPVIFDDNCSALGDKGDILLIDPSQYILLKKGNAKAGWSIHVEWLTDQQCFRIVYRLNGAPKMNSPVTLKNSAKTRSAFVALADRA